MAIFLETPVIEPIVPIAVIPETPLELFTTLRNSIRTLFFMKRRRSIHPEKIIKVLDMLQHSLKVFDVIEQQIIIQVISYVTHSDYQQALATLLKINYLEKPRKEAKLFTEVVSLNYSDYLEEPPILD